VEIYAIPVKNNRGE